MSVRNCITCNGKCLFITRSCFIETSTYFHSGLSSKDIDKAITLGQKKYIETLLGATCCTALCDAITASELATTDPGYAALSTAWETLIEVLTPLIVSGGEYRYIKKRGIGQLTAKGFQFDFDPKQAEAWKDFIGGLRVDADDEYQIVKDWLETTENRVNYPCLPALKTDDCKVEPDEDFTGSWGTTKYSQYGQNRF